MNKNYIVQSRKTWQCGECPEDWKDEKYFQSKYEAETYYYNVTGTSELLHRILYRDERVIK